MRILVYALLILCSVVIESRVEVGIFRPDITVLFAFYFGLRYGAVQGLLAGAGMGFLSDVLSGVMLGPGMLGKGTAGYLASYLRGGVFTWTPLLGFFGAFLATVCDGTLSYASRAVFSPFSLSTLDAAIMIFWQAAPNGVVGLFIQPGDEE
jgi:rod shape-determining protein MreD